MKKPFDIGGGWKAIQVDGGGVIIQTETGLVAVDWANIGEDGNLVNRYETNSAGKSALPVAGPTAISDFLEEINLRDLSSEGIYGPVGPTVKKFRDVLKTMDPASSLADSVGEFLATGDHLRHGPVASLVGLKPEQVTVLNSAIDRGDAADLEKVLDKFVVGGAVEEKSAKEEKKPVAAKA